MCFRVSKEALDINGILGPEDADHISPHFPNRKQKNCKYNTKIQNNEFSWKSVQKCTEKETWQKQRQDQDNLPL